MPIISLTLTEKTIYQHLLTAATEAIPTLAEALSAASIIRKEATPYYSLLYLEPKLLPQSLPRVPLEVRSSAHGARPFNVCSMFWTAPCT